MLARTTICNVTGRELSLPKSTKPWSEVVSSMHTEDQTGIHWYAVHCIGAPDERLHDCGQRVGWEVYIPKTRELRAIPKRKLPLNKRNSPFPVMAAQEVPLFPRYPLIKMDLTDPYRHDLFELLGVQGILCDGSGNKPQPAPIDEAFILALRAQEKGGVIPAIATLKQLVYDIGEQVRIRGGAFAGHNAEVAHLPDVPIEALDADHRLKLLVVLFGRKTVVEMTLGDIEKL